MRKQSEQEKFAHKYGMRLDDVRAYELRNGVKDAAQKFDRQREAAKERGIEWLFDLKGWLEVWDGKIAKRGRGRRALCMCRHKDQGPYSPTNVRIATGYENMLDWWEKKPKWRKYPATKGGMSKVARKEFEGDPKAEARMEVKLGFGARN